jgi:hypothetical protein
MGKVKVKAPPHIVVVSLQKSGTNLVAPILLIVWKITKAKQMNLSSIRKL